MTAVTGRTGEYATSARPRTGDLALYATGSIGMGVWATVPGLLSSTS
ncbi:hypothetical protein [Streptomyces sp. SID6139]